MACKQAKQQAADCLERLMSEAQLHDERGQDDSDVDWGNGGGG